MVARRRALEADLSAADRVEARAARVRRYLPVLDAELAEATAPFLDAIRVETPCRERWDEMEGDDVVRRCARCDRDVYDLSHMTCDEIAALFTRAMDFPCVRLQRRLDGRVVTADCPPQRPHAARRIRGTAAAVLIGGGLYAAGTLTPLGGARMVEPQPVVTASKKTTAVDAIPAEPTVDPMADIPFANVMGQAAMPPDVEPIAPADIREHIRPTGPRTWEVDWALVERALGQPRDMGSSRIVPRMRDGEVIGVALYGIRRRSMTSALGIRNGDVLLSVNGLPLTTPDSALRAYARMRVADALFVRLLRDGEERVHAYRLIR